MTRPRFFLSLAFFVLLLAGCQRFPQENTVDLAGAWSTARHGDLVAGRGYLGQPAYRAYLGEGLEAPKNGPWARRRQGSQRAHAVGFYLYRVQPLLVIVGARGRSPVTFFCGETRLKTVELQGSQQFDLRIEAGALKPGWNWIDIEGGEDLAIAQFQIHSWPAPLSSTSSLVAVSGTVNDTALQLTYGQSVEFPLISPGVAELDFSWEPWTEKGTSVADPTQYELQVSVHSEDGVRQSWTYSAPGPVSQPLPSGLGRFALRIESRWLGDERPLPGQLGLRLQAPHLRRSQAEEPPLSTPAPPTPTPRAREGTPPNVVLIVIDTLRADRMSVYGYEHPTTPHLERLAADGVVFDDFVAQSPWTKPSVASILTGLEPNQHRCLDFADALDPRLTSWAEILGEHGYRTLAAVANPLVGSHFQFDQGFADFQNLPTSTKAPEVGKKGLEKLESEPTKDPFFLYLHPIDPHLPYNPPAPQREQAFSWHGIRSGAGAKHPRLPDSDRKGFRLLSGYLYTQHKLGLTHQLAPETRRLVQALYDGEVLTADASVGEVVAWLKRQGLYEQTLIVVTSDHGEEVLDRGRLGHMHSMHQELTRVPLLIKFPDQRLAGTRVERKWQHVDLLPTVLHELGLSPTLELDGRAFPSPGSDADWDAFSEIRAGRDAVLASQSTTEFLELGWSLQKGDHKLIHYDSSRHRSETPRALYDLRTDPKELHNILLEKPVLGLFLEQELSRRRNRPALLVPEKAPQDATEDSMRALQYL